MNVVPLSDLQAPDDRVRRFTLLGLSLAGMLTAEAAAEFQQRVVASADLVEAVPDGTRASFERLRTIHSHGILCYETFTTVCDLAPMVADLALRERFLAFHANVFAAVARDGTARAVRVETVSQLVEKLQEGKLRLQDWPEGDRFAGGFGQLLRWARRQGFLSGQRARQAEKQLTSWRNRLAHPDHSQLAMPVRSARDIHNLAEIINRLWGAPTPGGRLYPAPVEREILALLYSEDGSASVGLVESLGHDSQPADVTVLLVRGVREDEGLFEYDAAFEHTRFPADLLWGPGGHREAVIWLEEQRPQPDNANYLDRWFVIRSDDAGTDRPRHPNVFAGLPESQRVGRWHLLRADFPEDAWLHVRFGHRPYDGACDECAAEGQAIGSWTELMTTLVDLGIAFEPLTAPEGRMPGLWPA